MCFDALVTLLKSNAGRTAIFRHPVPKFGEIFSRHAGIPGLVWWLRFSVSRECRRNNVRSQPAPGGQALGANAIEMALSRQLPMSRAGARQIRFMLLRRH